MRKIMKLEEAYRTVERLCDIPFIEDELRSLGYSDQEIPNLVKEIEPEASAALEKMKSLMARWDKLDKRPQ